MPTCCHFKPSGIPSYDLEEVILKVEEIEAIRLKDLLGLEQEACAERMGISRPTFQRLLVEAHQKVAEALVEGKALRIEGGAYDFARDRERCPRCDYSRLDKEATHCPKCNWKL